MKKLCVRRVLFSLICLIAVVAATLTASAMYREVAFDFKINGISAKTNGSYSEVIPAEAFTAEVSVTNKGDAVSVLVLLAAYAENGQMLQVQYQEKLFGKGETLTCSFEIQNAAGDISALKAFLLNSKNELIPVAKTFALSNLDSIVSAYANEQGELVVQTIGGKELVVFPCKFMDTFNDYEVGTRFEITSPVGEFDVPIVVDETEYIVHFNSIYYILTAKNGQDSAEAWRNGEYVPFEVTVYISAQTDETLAGRFVAITLAKASGGWFYTGFVEEDGSINIAMTQGSEEAPSLWYAPEPLFFQKVSISKKPNI